MRERTFSRSRFALIVTAAVLLSLAGALTKPPQTAFATPPSECDREHENIQFTEGGITYVCKFIKLMVDDQEVLSWEWVKVIPTEPPEQEMHMYPSANTWDILNASGQPEIFPIDTVGRPWHNWCCWSGWNALASPPAAPASPLQVASNPFIRNEAFMVATDSNVYHAWENWDGTWSGWASLGGSFSPGLTVGNNGDGRLELFAVNRDNAQLYHAWQTSPGGAWSGWSSLGGSWHTSPVVEANFDQYLEVFLVGDDHTLFEFYQASDGWHPRGLGGDFVSTRPSVVRHADGRLEAFVRDTSLAIQHIGQVCPSCGWGSWSSLAAATFSSDPTSERNGSGVLQVMARGTDNNLYVTSQFAINGGWNGWTLLGGPITSGPVMKGWPDGRIEAFMLGADSNGQSAMYHIWQTCPDVDADDSNCVWSNFVDLGGQWASFQGGASPSGALGPPIRR